jgi:DNA (cytosine-5)-methyltransferase 1
LADDDRRWWDADRVASFEASLSEVQRLRLESLLSLPDKRWRTAYRRTRRGVAVWEIRADDVSGCLRTARGGSSRQALAEVGGGQLRLRWMTGREYAALMGAPDHVIGVVSENQALFGLGDAVCVPAASWLVRSYLVPLALGQLAVGELAAVGAA